MPLMPLMRSTPGFWMLEWRKHTSLTRTPTGTTALGMTNGLVAGSREDDGGHATTRAHAGVAGSVESGMHTRNNRVDE